ncbi:MAG: VWA domain-containing protein [Flavobacteriales bacterium]|nr:VWA domain-containing protein [Flavobacteriales bacterium]MCB9448122.1 VWA domain-containing protein [Flavobacteriales bacterium]
MNKFSGNHFLVTTLIVCLLISSGARAQITGALKIKPRSVNFGVLDSVSSAKASFVLKNTGNKKIFIIRADVAVSMKVKISKRNIEPGDTALLTVLVVPESDGAFSEKIYLYHSGSQTPENLSVSGRFRHLLHTSNPMLACYTFSNKQTARPGQMVPIPLPKQREQEPEPTPTTEPEPVDTHVQASPPPTEPEPVKEPEQAPAPKQPEPKKEPEPIAEVFLDPEPTVKAPVEEESADLPMHLYKPTNLVLLVDVSGSMNDSLKLALLKTASLRTLKALRSVDRISLVTYADKASVLINGAPGNVKDSTEKVIRQLKAGGNTAGSEGIELAYKVADQNFIPDGNNVILLATDGAFNLTPSNETLFEEKQNQLYMSIAAIGEPGKLSKKVLKKIASKSAGRIVWIRTIKQAGKAMLAEIQTGARR